MTWSVIVGDAAESLRSLPAESVQCVVTSPPYWGLRDYGTAAWEGGDAGCDHKRQSEASRLSSTLANRQPGSDRNLLVARTQGGTIAYRSVCGKCGAARQDRQLGLEPTPELYVEHMVEVFREVRRVLRKDGTVWLNLGDSYAGSWGNQGRKPERGTQRPINSEMLTPVLDGRYPDKGSNTGEVPPGLKPKDLVGVPWRVAFALQADGWWLRSDIIWAKPNPMPESVTDRPTKAHEYVFLLTKSARYFYDADGVREPHTREPFGGDNGYAPSLKDHHARLGSQSAIRDGVGRMGNPEAGRNLRTVWNIATEPFPQAHFATFPTALVEPCIKAGTSEKGCCPECGAPWERMRGGVASEPQRENYHGQGVVPEHRGGGDRVGGFYPDYVTLGWRPSCNCEPAPSYGDAWPPIPCTVLDPFAGSGTVGVVACQFERSFIGIELNPVYAEMAERRIHNEAGLFSVQDSVK